MNEVILETLGCQCGAYRSRDCRGDARIPVQTGPPCDCACHAEWDEIPEEEWDGDPLPF